MLSTSSVNAQVVAGSQLEIGPSGSNQVQDAPLVNGAAIGSGNSVHGFGSAAFGYGNTLAGSSSGAFGHDNELIYTQGSFATGGGNSLEVVNFSLVVGTLNLTFMTFDPDEELLFMDSSLVAGLYNSTNARASLIVGQNNVSERSDYFSVSHSVIGSGLISKWSNSLVVGSYNDASIPSGAGLRFAVGNGANANNRSNALEVYADGKIFMPPQGDILMGEFGN